MSSIIHDIISDLGEYLPILIFLAVLVLVWTGASWSGFASLRTASRRRRFWFALVALTFGLIGVSAQFPFSLENDTFRFKCDCRWLFIVPLLFGVAGFFRWWRVRPQPSAATSGC